MRMGLCVWRDQGFLPVTIFSLCCAFSFNSESFWRGGDAVGSMLGLYRVFSSSG